MESERVIVADTHAWIWWISQPKLLPRAAAEAMANGFGIAAISSWEVAMLAEKRRISLDAETLHWLREATGQPALVPGQVAGGTAGGLPVSYPPVVNQQMSGWIPLGNTRRRPASWGNVRSRDAHSRG